MGGWSTVCSPGPASCEMMIDEETGCILLPGMRAVISSTLTRSQFLETSAFSAATVSVRNEPWCRFKLPGLPLPETELCIQLQFHAERLVSLLLCHGAARFGSSWKDWSEERELARKVFHEQWLTRELRIKLGNYAWGAISSDYDAEAGFSSISIRYVHSSSFITPPMPNGRPNDHAFSDLLVHGMHQFPSDIERLVRELHQLGGQCALNEFAGDANLWESGGQLDDARPSSQPPSPSSARNNPNEQGAAFSLTFISHGYSAVPGLWRRPRLRGRARGSSARCAVGHRVAGRYHSVHPAQV